MKFTENEWYVQKKKNILVPKIFTNGLNMVLPKQTRLEKTGNGVEIHWLFGKEKVLGVVISKEGHADILLVHERTYHCDFLEKGTTINNASYC